VTYDEKTIARFWSKVDRRGPEECWEWRGNRHALRGGYGRFGIGKTVVFAHRLAYRLGHDSDPGEMCVLHRCDNPGCVNPGHLFLGTRTDNHLDKMAKGRQRSGDTRGEKSGTAKLTGDAVAEIRALFMARSMSARAIGRRFGVSDTHVAKIARGEVWAHTFQKEPHART